MLVEEKRCRRCNETKPIEMFAVRKVASDGLDSHCRSCNAEKSRAYRAANLESERVKGREYAAKRRRDHPRRNRDLQLRSVYGISIDEHESMVEAQKGLCAICHRTPRGLPPANHTLHVDHCHETGKVRGLLCGDCNRALGLFSDDPGVLKNAMEYLCG